MTPLGPAEMRARRRPLVVLAIAAFRLLFGFCLAWPLATLVSESGVGQTPTGDRALFEGGGYLLLELARLQGANLAATVRGLLPLLLLGLALTAACNAALLIALNVRERLELKSWLGQALTRWPALLVLGFGTGFVQLMIVVLATLGSDAVPEPLARPVAASLGQLAVWLLAAALAGGAGGFSDVVKASLVRHGEGLMPALGRAARCLRLRPLATCFGFVPFAAVFLACALGAALLSEKLDVSAPGAWRVGAVFALHQLVVVSSVALRASWFARALRLAASAG